MNTIQAIIILKNGMKKYGSIVGSEFRHTVLFIPGAETLFTNTEAALSLAQYIPVDEIESIDTYLK